MSQPTTEEVREFWNSNPLCAHMIPHPLGSREYFDYYDPLRESIESIEYAYRLHEFRDFEGRHVLDVGSGNGYVLSKYAKEGANVYGVDITPAGIELCNKRFAYLGLKGEFRVADAQSLPFADNSFDCVCSMGVLHHVPDTAKAVAEIHRVLKPGDRLIVMFYHRNSAQYRIKFKWLAATTGKSMQQLVNEFDGVGNPKGDVYSKRELRELLAAFAPLELSVGYLTGDMVLPRGGRFVPDALVRPLQRFLGWNLYAKGRKPAR